MLRICLFLPFLPSLSPFLPPSPSHLPPPFLLPSQVVIDKPLLHRVKVEESMWNLDRENGYIQVNLEKTKEIMWKSVLEGEPGIDLTKVGINWDIVIRALM